MVTKPEVGDLLVDDAGYIMRENKRKNVGVIFDQYMRQVTLSTKESVLLEYYKIYWRDTCASADLVDNVEEYRADKLIENIERKLEYDSDYSHVRLTLVKMNRDGKEVEG